MRETIVFVGAVVMRENQILLVRQSAGHPLEGQWTVPWGRIENGESPAVAAIRETWEEGGVGAIRTSDDTGNIAELDLITVGS